MSSCLLEQGFFCLFCLLFFFLIFFNPLMQIHKGEQRCISAGRRAELIPGDPIAITEDTLQWMSNKNLPPRLWLILYSPRKSSLFIFTLTKCLLLISGKTNPQASADLLLKTTYCAVEGIQVQTVSLPKKSSQNSQGSKRPGHFWEHPTLQIMPTARRRWPRIRERPQQEGGEDLPFPRL